MNVQLIKEVKNVKNSFVLKYKKECLFLIVGSFGFLVDVTSFYITFEYFKFDIIIARGIAFLVAVLTTWFGNKTFTFKLSKKKEPLSQVMQSIIASTIALIPNMFTFMLVNQYLGDFFLAPYIALTSGIIVGLSINYTLSNNWVFK